MNPLVLSIAQPELAFDDTGLLRKVEWRRIENRPDHGVLGSLSPGWWWLQAFVVSGSSLPDSETDDPPLDREIAAWIREQVGEATADWQPWPLFESLTGARREPSLGAGFLSLQWCVAEDPQPTVLWVESMTLTVAPERILTIHRPVGIASSKMVALDPVWADAVTGLADRPEGVTVISREVFQELDQASPDLVFQLIVLMQIEQARLGLRESFRSLAATGDVVESQFYTAVDRATEQGEFERSMLVSASSTIVKLGRMVEDVLRGLPPAPIPAEPDLPTVLVEAIDRYASSVIQRRDELRNLADDLARAAALINGTAAATQLALANEQLIAAQRQAEAAELRAAHSRSLQALAAVIATVFVVPSLIATVYAANVAVPARGSTEGLIALLALMVCGALVASLAVKLIEPTEASPISDAQASSQPRDRRPWIALVRQHNVRVTAAVLLLVIAIVLSAAKPFNSTPKPAGSPITTVRKTP